ncbi:dual specificity protein phosphatase 12 isoform X3 [Pogona vitticeps]
MAAVLVLPGLYLSARDPSRPECVGDAAVRALLVVEDSEPPEAAAASASGLEAVLHVPLLDQPESDLLSRLDDCVAFIGGARERGGGVLVRCQAGVSRSVAVVTAYLMKANTLSFEEAYAFVKDIKPDAKINEGFEWQLKLYEKMGCEVDVTSPVYKQYRLQKVTEKYPELADLPREVFAVDPNNVHQIPSHETVYKCRKCRTGGSFFGVQAFCLMMRAKDLQHLLTRGFHNLYPFTIAVGQSVRLTSLSLYSGWSQRS